MFETAVIATDGSESAQRAVAVGLDLASKFDAAVHALSVTDEDDADRDLRAELESAHEDALRAVREHADRSLTTTVRAGDPAAEICSYAHEVDADVVVTGTRGRHGDHAFLLGSVAEAVVRQCPVPVLTVRQLGDDEPPRPSEQSPY